MNQFAVILCCITMFTLGSEVRRKSLCEVNVHQLTQLQFCQFLKLYCKFVCCTRFIEKKSLEITALFISLGQYL